MNLNNIPEEMKQYQQFVLGNKEKLPINCNTGLYAKTNDTTTWDNFTNCINYYNNNTSVLSSGIGFVLTEKDPYVCIDLDHCITDGKINSNVLAILNQFKGCYIETSISGSGIHIFCKGSKHIKETTNKTFKTEEEPLIEIYNTGHYILMTGNMYYKPVSDIIECQTGINFVETYYFKGRQKGKKKEQQKIHTGSTSANISGGMTVTEIKEMLHSQHPTFLTKDKKDGYICPLCNSGAGKNGTGIKQYKDETSKIVYHCFDCQTTGDTIDWWSYYRNLGDVSSDNLVDIIKDYATEHNIQVKNTVSNDVPFTIYNGLTTEPEEIEEFTQDNIEPTEVFNEEISLSDIVFTSFMESIGCKKYINKPEYLDKLGISLCYIKDKKEVFKCLCKKNIKNHIRYYSFTGDYDTTINNTFKFDAPVTNSFCSSFIVFTNNFVDSLVLTNIGLDVIQVSDTNISGIRYLLLKNQKEWKYKSVIFTFCNEETEPKLKKEIEDINLDFNFNTFTGSSGLTITKLNKQNHTEFTKIVSGVLSDINTKIKNNNQDTFGYWFTNRFKRDKEVQEKRISTGIHCFDNVINGGLPVGLTVLGAETSLGKTTFLTQIAENLCNTGNVVLYFNLEQSQFEVFSKGMKRQCYRDGKGTIFKYDTETANSFYKYVNYSNYNVIECDFNTTIETVKDKINKVKRHLKTSEDGSKQQIVIFIDYLQALQLEVNGKIVTNMSDKQKTDKLIHDLKVLSKETETPIVAVSSLNRDSYKKGIDLKSFKESGSIEYTANILLGMSKVCKEVGGKWIPEPDIDGIRKVFIKQMKDRNGERDKKCVLEFNLEYQYFYDPFYSAEEVLGFKDIDTDEEPEEDIDGDLFDSEEDIDGD